MRGLSRLLQRGVAQQERLLGNPFIIYKGQKLPCLPGAPIEAGFDLEFGGMVDTTKCQIIIRKNLFKSLRDWTIDSKSITIDSTKYITDRYGNVFPNFDLRRKTIEAMMQLRRAITLDKKHLTIDCCSISIDSEITAEANYDPITKAFGMVIESDEFPAVPGQDPLTLDSKSLTIDSTEKSIDHNINVLGYLDPIVLPDLDNVYARGMDADIEQLKSEFETDPDYARTIDDSSLQINLEEPTLDEESPEWSSLNRIAGVYQEDQGMNFGKKLKVGELVEYRGEIYRVEAVQDPGVYEAFYNVTLEANGV